MDGFTLVDAAVAGIILISAILAFSRGFVREVLSIAGWILATVVAYTFAPQAEPLIKELPVVGDLLADSCELSILAAFTGVFTIALIVVSVFTPLFSNLVQKSALGGFDQGLGFLFGILRGVVLIAIAFVLYDKFVPAGQGVEMIEKSRTAAVFAETKDVIEKQVPTEAPEWITMRYGKLTSNCVPNGGLKDGAAESGTSGT